MRGPIVFLAATLSLCGLLVACESTASQTTSQVADPTVGSDLVDSAAAQATAIVQEAEATAMVLRAQARATAVMAQALEFNPTPSPGPTSAQPVFSGDQPAASPTPTEALLHTPEPEVPQTVEVLQVGLAADGGFIIVRFMAPPAEAAKWWQGSVSVTDEGNGAVYNEIPLMPKVGLMIARPKVAGQGGYVLLVNAPPWLRSGAVVTVVLGAHQFEHVPVL
jgi:hypothetical protein